MYVLCTLLPSNQVFKKLISIKPQEGGGVSKVGPWVQTAMEYKTVKLPDFNCCVCVCVFV